MSRSAERYIHPPRGGLGWRVEAVLEAIPTDRWVTSAEIAAQVGVSARKVAMVIRYHLLHKYVERSPQRKTGHGGWLYRRFTYVGDSPTPAPS